MPSANLELETQMLTTLSDILKLNLYEEYTIKFKDNEEITLKRILLYKWARKKRKKKH